MKCCKCNKIAHYAVDVNDKKFLVCKEHIPNKLSEGMEVTKLELDLISILKQNNHIANLKGKEYVLFGGLLWIAHQQGLKSINTEIIELNRKEQFCLIKTTVEGERGKFCAYGDADPSNTGKMVLSAYIRMAETRSIARSLRLYNGIGMTALEELPPNPNKEK